MLEGNALDERTIGEDPRARLLAAPMSPFQITAIIATIALCALDGFDVLAITFAAPAIAAQWHIGKAQIGLVLSAGLLGLALGSLFIAPIADVVGRRRVILVSLLITIVGALWTSVVSDMSGLLWSRIFTGIGIGAMVAVGNPLAAEYANAKRRDLTVSLLNVGYPVGGILGGFLAAYLLAHFGWRAIFVSSAVGGGLGLLVTLIWLPDPVSFLVARPKGDALAKVNAYLGRCGIAPVSALPPPPAGGRGVPIKALFQDGMGWVTVRMTLAYFLFVLSLFYMQTWVATLATMTGLTTVSASIVAVYLSVGGVLGGLVVAVATLRVPLKAVVLAAMLAGSASIVLFGFLPSGFGLIAAGAGVAGFFLFGAMIANYAVVARTFPAHMRASGTGIVVGIGRFGSVLAPTIAGYLFSQGLGRPGVGLIMAVPAVLAAGVLLTLKLRPPTTA